MSKRFKLVFLSENEDYITDVGCSIDVRRSNTGNHLDPGIPGSLAKLFRGGEFKGRIRIGSMALYLDFDAIDEFIRVPFLAFSEVTTIGADCIVVRASQLCAIPVKIINGKTRLLKPYLTISTEVEISLTVHSTHLPEVLGLIQTLFRLRVDKEGLHTFVHSTLSRSATPFDLTSLSSHREALVLPQALKVVRIKKMIEINGLLQLSRNYMYFQAIPSFGFKKVKKFALLSPDGSPAYSSNTLRYKLKDSGVEFMFANGKNLFILFQSASDRQVFMSALPQASAPAHGTGITFPAIETVTEMWTSGSISNFSYLMYLNVMAGRSLNDIGQYPIFPWTVSDMTSPVLNLESPASFRDLSVPIAATNKVRLLQYKERAMHMPESERFLFGSFYSNPAFVVYFLIRKFPECHLRLHGGHFDHTARLFTSLRTAWEAVSETGSGTMELIPEFYSGFETAASWLANSPSMTVIPEVALPPWAASPRDLVILLRCALESPTMSAQLHLWIDLVFGVKSRGRQICFDNDNLFHPICYLTDTEGDVIPFCKQQETTRDVVTLQSQEFGHVPKQIFVADSHPKRNLSNIPKEVWSPEYYARRPEMDWRQEISHAFASRPKDVPENSQQAPLAGPSMLKPVAVTGKSLSSFQIEFRDVEMPAKPEGCFFSDLLVGTTVVVASTNTGFVTTVNHERRFRVSSKSITCLAASLRPNEVVCGDALSGQISLVSSTDGLLRSKAVHDGGVTCIDILNDELGISGSLDHSVAVWSRKSLELIYTLDAHSAKITCLRSTGDGQTFVSGDAKGVIAFWDINHVLAPRWLSSATNHAVVSIDCSFDRAVVIDATGTMTFWDMSGYIVWKHPPKDEASKLVAARFPVKEDPSLIVAFSKSSAQAFKFATVNNVPQLNFVVDRSLGGALSIVSSGRVPATLLEGGKGIVVSMK